MRDDSKHGTQPGPIPPEAEEELETRAETDPDETQPSLDTTVVSPHPPHNRPAPDDLAGDMVGQYRIVSVLGKGGMGVVYEAEQQNPRRRVAL